MPIGTGIIYNVGDLILSTVSGSGTAFLETKIAAATSSIVYFDSNARINSASLNSITVGTASYVSGSTSIITNLTASNISASGTSSFGMVGIGTPSPNDLLQLQASSATAYDETSDNGQYGSGAGITITNMDLTAQSFAQVNLQVSGQSGRALGRIVAIRTASATSDLAFVTENANTKAEKMRILSDGNLGIGTTAPGAKLEISSSTAASLLNIKGAGGNGILFVSGSGNIGIGTTSPVAKLQTYATNTGSQFLMSGQDGVNSLNFGLGFSVNSQTFATIAGYYTNSGGSGAGDLTFYTKTISTSLSEKMRIQADGNVGIGNSTPRALLDLAKTNNAGQIILIGETATNYRTGFGLDSATAGMRIFCPNLISEAIYIGGISTSDGTTFTRNHSFGVAGKNSWLNEQGGNVGIGTTTPTYKLQVNGSFAATTKSFDIPHPTKENKRLVYASLEGPENGVYIRGKNDSKVIELPDYWVELVHEESVTVNLTAIGKNKDKKITNYSIEKIQDNKVYVYTDSPDDIYNYYFAVYGERKDVSKLIVEKDIE